MRFFIGAIVSSLILSPISVLSTAIDDVSAEVGANGFDGSTQVGVAELGQSLTSHPTLEKRFCIRKKCRKEREAREVSGYQCEKKHISIKRIRKAENAACPYIKKDKKRRGFPSPYTASDFVISGPYLEWPVSRNGRFWNIWRKGKYRIVMTTDCEVVGVVIRRKDSSYTTCKNLSKNLSKNDDDDDDDE